MGRSVRCSGRLSCLIALDAIVLLDGLHTGYANGKPGPLESELEVEPLAPFLKFAAAAKAGDKAMLVTHSEVFPGTFASTTETADYLVKRLAVRAAACP